MLLPSPEKKMEQEIFFHLLQKRLLTSSGEWPVNASQNLFISLLSRAFLLKNMPSLSPSPDLPPMFEGSGRRLPSTSWGLESLCPSCHVLCGRCRDRSLRDSSPCDSSHPTIHSETIHSYDFSQLRQFTSRRFAAGFFTASYDFPQIRFFTA